MARAKRRGFLGLLLISAAACSSSGHATRATTTTTATTLRPTTTTTAISARERERRAVDAANTDLESRFGISLSLLDAWSQVLTLAQQMESPAHAASRLRQIVAPIRVAEATEDRLRADLGLPALKRTP